MRFLNKGFIIPYQTTDGERAMVRFRFHGDVDRRRVRRELRKRFRPMGITIDNHTLNWLLRNRQYDIYGNA